MPEKSALPHGENLRNAIRWLSEQNLYPQSHIDKTYSREIIENASLMFDLTPLEEEFLIRKFVVKEDQPDNKDSHT
jgi:hypothetical protein